MGREGFAKPLTSMSDDDGCGSCSLHCSSGSTTSSRALHRMPRPVLPVVSAVGIGIPGLPVPTLPLLCLTRRPDGRHFALPWSFS